MLLTITTKIDIRINKISKPVVFNGPLQPSKRAYMSFSLSGLVNVNGLNPMNTIQQQVNTAPRNRIMRSRDLLSRQIVILLLIS